MKKCPVCSRTYSDETLSFCLEDGSLLSASFNLSEEQETILKPAKSKIASTEYFPAATDNYNERQTIASVKDTNLTSTQSREARIIQLVILLGIWFPFLVMAAYTGSFIPLLFALVITLIYKAVQKFIK